VGLCVPVSLCRSFTRHKKEKNGKGDFSGSADKEHKSKEREAEHNKTVNCQHLSLVNRTNEILIQTNKT
jgi:hypothetical protein